MIKIVHTVTLVLTSVGILGAQVACATNEFALTIYRGCTNGASVVHYAGKGDSIVEVLWPSIELT
jgi:hypothetical protein